MLEVRKHPGTGLLVREDGAVRMPKSNHHPAPEWVFGTAIASGYRVIGYCNRQHLVHRIVAEAFLPNPSGFPSVDHIDRNRSNNAVGNLRWADYKTQNENHGNVLNRANYGARHCEDKKAYSAVYGTIYYAGHTSQRKEYAAKYYAKMKSLGFAYRRGTDGKKHWVRLAAEKAAKAKAKAEG